MKFDHKRIDIRRIEGFLWLELMASKVCQQEVKKKKGIDAKRSDQAGRSIHAKKKCKIPYYFCGI